MASISEGITVEGEAANSGGDLSQSAFDSMLAEQATKSYDEPAAPATPEPRRDLSADSVEQVYLDVLAPTSGTADIRDGLSVEVPELPEPRREPLDAESAELVRQAERQLERQQEALIRGADHADEIARRDAIDLVRAGDGEGALEAYIGLAERSPALLDQALRVHRREQRGLEQREQPGERRSELVGDGGGEARSELFVGGELTRLTQVEQLFAPAVELERHRSRPPGLGLEHLLRHGLSDDEA